MEDKIHADRSLYAADFEIAERLIAGGMRENEVFQANATDYLYDVETRGQVRQSLGRPVRNSLLFPSVAARRQDRESAFMGCYLREHELDEEDVIYIVARPTGGPVCIDDVRDEHAAQSKRLSEALRYAVKAKCPDVEVIGVSAEHDPANEDGSEVDLHFNVLMVGSMPLDQEYDLRCYLEKAGFATWFNSEEEDAEEERAWQIEQLARYFAKGPAASARKASEGRAYSDENLAKLFRQLAGVSTIRARGSYRDWKSDMAHLGLVARLDEEGVGYLTKATQRPRRPRSKAFRFQGTGFTLQTVCVASFGDDLRERICLRVRVEKGCPPPSWDYLARVYDLSAVFRLYENTTTPESQKESRSKGGRLSESACACANDSEDDIPF